MDSRTLFDAALVAIAGLLAYTETFGFANPRATLADIIAIFANMDIRVYLVVSGFFGIIFVAYLVVYLPKKDARTTRP